MNGPRPAIRLLHVEDSELDHVLALAYLEHDGWVIDARRVETREAFATALAEPWDAVLSDYQMPGFTGLQALQMLRDSGSSLPFILVSGLIGEDTAVEAMRNGASDYLLKDNLSRLGPALDNAIAAGDGRRARLAADRELSLSRQRLSELAQHLQTSVEAERHAIAREIHDDVGGSLTALKFELDWLRRHVRVDPGADDNAELQAHLGSALELVTHAIDSSQRIMQNLRPAILEQGLVAALQWMTSSFARRTGIACEFRTGRERDAQHERLHPQQRLRLPAGVPLVAYRTAQEALTNASKHAQATKVVVDLSFSAGVLSLEISDNGRGLNTQELEKSGSFGIRGLHERASTVGGWVDLSSSVAGTTLILSVPLDHASGPVTEAGDNLDDESSAWSPL